MGAADGGEEGHACFLSIFDGSDCEVASEAPRLLVKIVFFCAELIVTNRTW